jgi:hypothetical protein
MLLSEQVLIRLIKGLYVIQNKHINEFQNALLKSLCICLHL